MTWTEISTSLADALTFTCDIIAYQCYDFLSKFYRCCTYRLQMLLNLQREVQDSQLPGGLYNLRMLPWICKFVVVFSKICTL